MTSTSLRRTMRWAFAAMVIAGLGIAGVAAFDLTAGETQQAQNQQSDAETPLVEAGEPSDNSSSEAFAGDLKVGQVFAKLRAPRLGANYVRNIAEGTSVDRVLNTVGIGHYVKTALPGEPGNFAIAAHRAGNGGPFRNIDKFIEGDLVAIETATHLYTYKYLGTKIVEPSDIDVIAPMPKDVADLMSKAPEAKLLTLTTCTPIYINTQRLIVWFALESSQAR